MVLDLLTQSSRYTALHAGLAEAFAFLARPDLAGLPEGRHPIRDTRIYALVQEYQTQPLAAGFLEAHRNYLDVQFIVHGEEWIGYAPLTNQTIQTPYDAARDIAFYQGTCTPCHLHAGMFAIFFPADAHLPARTIATPGRVRKVVVKVSVQP
jgi:YhcH/YjgK/YiaL family protein